MVSCGISTTFAVLSPNRGKVAHALLTRPPLKHIPSRPKPFQNMSPLDLHVLGTPPAFVLSQDQTLTFNPFSLSQLLSLMPSLSPRPSPRSLASLSHSESSVFSCVSCLCIVFKVRSRASRKALVYNTKHLLFCQAFFQVFSRFFASFLLCEHNTFHISPMFVIIRSLCFSTLKNIRLLIHWNHRRAPAASSQSKLPAAFRP